MRIVQAVSWYFPESSGGTEVYVAGLSRRLTKWGNDVWIVAPDAGAADERRYEHEGLPVVRYPIPKAPTRAEAQERAPVRGAARFGRILEELKPDVVHFHTFVTGLGLFEVSAAKKTGARVVVTTHSSSLGYLCQRGTLMRWGEVPCDGICRPVKCAACVLQKRGLSKPVAWAVAALPPALGSVAARVPGKIGTGLGMSHLITFNQSKQRALLHTADGFVVLTAGARDMVAANGARRDKLVLNRLGFSQALARKPGPDVRPTGRPVRIGYLGRFDEVKGVRDLARAVTLVPSELPLVAELRGPVLTPSEAAIESDVRRLVAGDPRVAFAPPVPPSEVGAVLAGYDVLCCPSVCAEGGPTVAIEAHAVGTPVVGSRIGGLSELVTDGVNGRLVPPGDFRELARVLEHVARDPGGTVDLWRRALPEARTMDDVAREYVALYENAARSSTAP